MKPDELFPFRVEDLEQLSQRVEVGSLEEGDRKRIGQALSILIELLKRIEETRISFRRLQNLWFGKRSEKQKRLPSDPSPASSASPSAPPDPSQSDSGSAGPSPLDAASEQLGPGKGHGRLAASAYTGAQLMALPHPDLKAKDRCPRCDAGSLFEIQPSTDIRIVGHAPASAIRYQQQRLRCSGCGQIFTAPLPAEAGPHKYDEKVKAVLAVLKQSCGMPLHRLERLQAGLGVPLPAATQWGLIEAVADAARPIYHALQRVAAQAEVLYADDSPVKILSLMAENRQLPEPERPGMQTTVIVAQTGDHWVTLYESGRRHAGENLAELLRRRTPGLKPPIQMTDALASNQAHAAQVLVSHCLVHARRKFHEIREFFPEVCERVLRDLGRVYHQEALAQQQQLTDEERLAHHQQHSAPVMESLQQWLQQQMSQHPIEPNSSLGKAVRYLLGHWEALTQFVRIPRAPLDNNPAERALKTPILNRKNAYFYKTTCGALVGSLLMSLIRTCAQCGANPIDYLVAVQKHAAEVRHHPQLWLPWNWRDQPVPR
jgi:hypothetical protein